MTADEINIPKIDFSESSVLVPKMEKHEEVVTHSTPPAQTQTMNQDQPTGRPEKGNGLLLKISIGFLALILVLVVAIGIPAFLTYQKGLVLYKSVKDLEVATKSQDLTKIKSQINVTSSDLNNFKSSYQLLSWTRIIPYFGGYVSDVGHAVNAAQAGMTVGQTVVTAIEPYADLLGLKGANGQQVNPATDGTKTAQDRVNFIVQSLPNLLPQIDKISASMKMVQDEASQIDAERYPVSLKGIAVRADIKSAQDLISQAATLLVNGKPVIEDAPYLLGMDSPRTYFVLFQNDKELRPTGGFYDRLCNCDS